MSSTETAPEIEKKVKLSSLRSDKQREREGEWIPAIDIDPNVVGWYVRSTNFPAFKLARNVASQKLARVHGDNIPDDVMAEVSGKLAVEHLLLDWKGLDVEYSKEAAAEILTDDEYRTVRASVYLAASKVGRDEIDYVEVTAKN